jgi:hypothetical protein
VLKLDAYTTALPFSNLEEWHLLPSPPDEDILQSQEIKGKVRYAHVTDKSTNHHISTCMHPKRKKICPKACTHGLHLQRKNHSMHHKNILKHAFTACIQKKFVGHNMHLRFAFTRKFQSHKHASTYQHEFKKIAPHHASTCIPSKIKK